MPRERVARKIMQPDAFRGWLRLHGPWIAVVSGSDEADVFERLQMRAKLHEHVDMCVLPSGTDPNLRLQRARR